MGQAGCAVAVTVVVIDVAIVVVDGGVGFEGGLLAIVDLQVAKLY